MRRFILILILTFFSYAKAAESIHEDLASESPVSQIILRPSKDLNIYLTKQQEAISSLQLQNADLIEQVLALQSYRKLADSLQQQVTQLQQAYAILNNQNQLLQTQLNQSRQDLQNSASQTKTINANTQKLQDDYNNSRQQLLEAQERIIQLQRSTKDVNWFNEQIQSKNKKINELNVTIGDLKLQNYELNQAKTNCETQLKDKLRQLEASQQATFQSSKDTQEHETSLQSLIHEKNVQVAKWRKENEQLKSQLDEAFSINSELRQKIKQLENLSH